LLKQSRNALLADITLRVLETCRTIDVSIPGWIKGYREAFIKIDKKMGMDLGNSFIVGLEAANKVWEKRVKEKEKNT